MNNYPTYLSPLVDRFLKHEKLQPEDYYIGSNQFDLFTTTNLLFEIENVELREKFCKAVYGSYQFYSVTDHLPEDMPEPQVWYEKLNKSLEILTTTSFTSTATATPTREVAVVDKEDYEHTLAQADKVPEMEKIIKEQNRQIEILTQNEKVKKELAETLYYATEKFVNKQYDSDYMQLCQNIVNVTDIYEGLTTNITKNYDCNIYVMLNIIGLLKAEHIFIKDTRASELDRELCTSTTDRSKYVLYATNPTYKKITKIQETGIRNWINAFKNQDQ